MFEWQQRVFIAYKPSFSIFVKPNLHHLLFLSSWNVTIFVYSQHYAMASLLYFNYFFSSGISSSSLSRSTPSNFELVAFDACARNSSLRNCSSFVNVLTFSSSIWFSAFSLFTLVNVSCVRCFVLNRLFLTACK